MENVFAILVLVNLSVNVDSKILSLILNKNFKHHTKHNLTIKLNSKICILDHGILIR